MRCSICKREIPVCPHTGWNKGNNAEPVNSGRCCDDCNAWVVIPARIKLVQDANIADQTDLS